MRNLENVNIRLVLSPFRYLLLPLLMIVLLPGCRIDGSVEASGGLYTSDSDYHRTENQSEYIREK